MFDDPKKELELLQEQLLKDEEWFEKELDSAKRMIGQLPEKKTRRTAASKTARNSKAAQPRADAAPVRNYANGYGKNEAPAHETQVEEAPVPKKKGIKGLLILAGLELLGILGIVAYWMLVLL